MLHFLYCVHGTSPYIAHLLILHYTYPFIAHIRLYIALRLQILRKEDWMEEHYVDSTIDVIVRDELIKKVVLGK